MEGQIGSGKIFQSARPADGIAQFHPPDHTSAEARQRSVLDWRAEWLRQNFSVSPAGRPMALLSFIRPTILQPRRGGGLVWTEGQSG
jgi:hypothetical protein